MKTNSTNSHLAEIPNCDKIQANLSDKLDQSQSFSTQESKHLNSCSDCQDFIDFLKNDKFLEIASAPMSQANDLTESIMQQLQHSDKVINPKPSQWRKIISIGSLAAASAVMISLTANQSPEASTETAESLDPTPSPAPVAKLDEKFIKENLQSQYQAISSVADEKWNVVSHNLSNAKEYVSKKTEKFSQIILFRNEDTPQSMNEPDSYFNA